MDTVAASRDGVAGPYGAGLGRRQANHTPLTPLSFLPKAAAVHPDAVALVHGTWRSTCRAGARSCSGSTSIRRR